MLLAPRMRPTKRTFRYMSPRTTRIILAAAGGFVALLAVVYVLFAFITNP